MESPSRSMARLGFRRWYERQLLESFAWLATCLLSGVAFGAVIEFVGFAGPGLTPLFAVVALYFIGLVGLTAFRAFWAQLSRAQRLADAATCSRCQTYGLLDIAADSEPTHVRCRKCASEWRLE